MTDAVRELWPAPVDILSDRERDIVRIYSANSEEARLHARAIKEGIPAAVEVLKRPTEGYEDMPTEKVRAITVSGKAWDKPSAEQELRRRHALALLRGDSDAE